MPIAIDPTIEGKQLCLTIFGYRKEGLSTEAYRKYMNEKHAPLVQGLMVKYGFTGFNMTHVSPESRALMSLLYDHQFANVADFDSVIQITFPNIECFVQMKADPYFKGEVGPDHEHFADTKKSQMTIGFFTPHVVDGKIAQK